MGFLSYGVLGKARQFRLVNNNGPLVGQTVFHTHIHFLSGKAAPDTDYTLMDPA